MTTGDWGSTEWNENHFPVDKLDTEGDTWGIRWRGMEKMRHHSYLHIVGNHLKKPEPINFLDIGCALCDFTIKAWHLNRSNNVWAMDVSETAITWDTKNFPEFTFQVGAAPDIPFDVEFDVVFFLEIMCYLNSEERVQAIRNIHDKLKTGGRILFSGVLDGGVQHHTTDEVVRLIGSEFTIEKIHYNHWSLHRAIVENPLMKIDNVASRISSYLTMTTDEFGEAKTSILSGKNGTVLRIMRALSPLSIWLFKSISWMVREIVSWKFLATIFHGFSKLVRGSDKADEIVVLGVKVDSK